MYKKITMHNAKGEEIEVEFLANAATPLRYKSIFRKDLLTQFANAKSEDNDKIKLDIDFLPELAFLMSMQAEAFSNPEVKLDKLTPGNLVDWLERFDSFEIESHAEDILNVYYGNTDTTSTSKKNTDEQIES